MKRLTMIVEDDPTTREYLGGIFTLRGWDVCLAPTVAEALTLLDHGPEPDFLILDLGLPDGGGDAVPGAVKRAGLGTLVVVCTGTSGPLRLMRVREMRPGLTIIKPIDPDVLCRLCGGGAA